MLTPCVKPVTAGKKIANSGQKPSVAPGARQLPARVRVSKCTRPPAKKETSARSRIAMIPYWKRVARSAPSHASTSSRAAAPAAAKVTTCGESEPSTAATPSPKPMQ